MELFVPLILNLLIVGNFDTLILGTVKYIQLRLEDMSPSGDLAILLVHQVSHHQVPQLGVPLLYRDLSQPVEGVIEGRKLSRA